MKKHVIIMNGPPFSGKDTAANIVESKYSATHLRFKTKIYQLVSLIYNLDLNTFINIATDVEKKESVILADGKTARELLIYVSEKCIKPAYGKDYFGIDVGDKIKKTDNKYFVISDSGFVDELRAMIKSAEFKGSDITILRLFKDGCNFDNDSRDYIPTEVMESLNINYHDIYNNSTIKEFDNVICSIVDNLNI